MLHAHAHPGQRAPGRAQKHKPQGALVYPTALLVGIGQQPRLFAFPGNRTERERAAIYAHGKRPAARQQRFRRGAIILTFF